MSESLTASPFTAQWPSLKYLLYCSRESLRDLELVALNRPNNCLRVAKTEWDEAVAQREIAGVARWLVEHRDELLQLTSRTVEAREVPELPGHTK
jgi:hypothetical protein